jgi:hypothetical protein
MFDQILSSLEQQAGPALMSKLGLNQQQVTNSMSAAKDSVAEVIGGGDGFGLDDVLNLFSNATNTSAANGIVDKLGSVLHGKLTNQVGLDAAKAGGVKDMILPLLTDLVTKHVNGDSSKLSGLLGNLGGNTNIGEMAKGLLGKLFS